MTAGKAIGSDFSTLPNQGRMVKILSTDFFNNYARSLRLFGFNEASDLTTVVPMQRPTGQAFREIGQWVFKDWGGSGNGYRTDLLTPVAVTPDLYTANGVTLTPAYYRESLNGADLLALDPNTGSPALWGYAVGTFGSADAGYIGNYVSNSAIGSVLGRSTGTNYVVNVNTDPTHHDSITLPIDGNTGQVPELLVFSQTTTQVKLYRFNKFGPVANSPKVANGTYLLGGSNPFTIGRMLGSQFSTGASNLNLVGLGYGTPGDTKIITDLYPALQAYGSNLSTPILI